MEDQRRKRARERWIGTEMWKWEEGEENERMR